MSGLFSSNCSSGGGGGIRPSPVIQRRRLSLLTPTTTSLLSPTNTVCVTVTATAAASSSSSVVAHAPAPTACQPAVEHTLISTSSSSSSNSMSSNNAVEPSVVIAAGFDVTGAEGAIMSDVTYTPFSSMATANQWPGGDGSKAATLGGGAYDGKRVGSVTLPAPPTRPLSWATSSSTSTAYLNAPVKPTLAPINIPATITCTAGAVGGIITATSSGSSYAGGRVRASYAVANTLVLPAAISMAPVASPSLPPFSSPTSTLFDVIVGNGLGSTALPSIGGVLPLPQKGTRPLHASLLSSQQRASGPNSGSIGGARGSGATSYNNYSNSSSGGSSVGGALSGHYQSYALPLPPAAVVTSAAALTVSAERFSTFADASGHRSSSSECSTPPGSTHSYSLSGDAAGSAAIGRRGSGFFQAAPAVGQEDESGVVGDVPTHIRRISGTVLLPALQLSSVASSAPPAPLLSTATTTSTSSHTARAMHLYGPFPALSLPPPLPPYASTGSGSGGSGSGAAQAAAGLPALPSTLPTSTASSNSSALKGGRGWTNGGSGGELASSVGSSGLGGGGGGWSYTVVGSSGSGGGSAVVSSTTTAVNNANAGAAAATSPLRPARTRGNSLTMPHLWWDTSALVGVNSSSTSSPSTGTTLPPVEVAAAAVTSPSISAHSRTFSLAAELTNKVTAVPSTPPPVLPLLLQPIQASTAYSATTTTGSGDRRRESVGNSYGEGRGRLTVTVAEVATGVEAVGATASGAFVCSLKDSLLSPAMMETALHVSSSKPRALLAGSTLSETEDEATLAQVAAMRAQQHWSTAAALASSPSASLSVVTSVASSSAPSSAFISSSPAPSTASAGAGKGTSAVSQSPLPTVAATTPPSTPRPVPVTPPPSNTGTSTPVGSTSI